MSILEAIKEAEAKAEALKQEASVKAESLLSETKVKVEAEVKSLFDNFEKQKLDLDHKAAEEIKTKEKQLDNAYLNEDQKTEQIARNNIDKTINYIMKKVMTI